MSAKQLKARTTIIENEVQELSLDAIEWLPEMLQVRENLDKSWSLEYSRSMVKEKELFPPLLVYRLPADDEHPTGRLVLSDGFHRVDAARSIGLRSFRAVIKDGTITDALLAAIEANTAAFHRGRKFEEADRKHAVELMIRNEETRDWPDKHIASFCDVAKQVPHKIRLQLKAQHGIPLPERVRVFKGGVPSDRTTPYRMAKLTDRFPTGTQVVKKNKTKTKYITQIDGKPLHLGYSAEVATARLQEIKEDRATKTALLANLPRFLDWLNRRMIFPDLIPKSSCPFQGYRCGSAAFYPVASPDVDKILNFVARLLLSRASECGIDRMVVIGYVRGIYSVITGILSLAERLGIEFMTPEEFVAEFGPKDGADQPEPSDDPDPAG